MKEPQKVLSSPFFFFFFNDTATTEIYTLSLHDALPICRAISNRGRPPCRSAGAGFGASDRKSTRLNSSHVRISYAVFCLKKKNHGSLTCDESASEKPRRHDGPESTGVPRGRRFFFFNDTATTEIYTLSLHDALPI